VRSKLVFRILSAFQPRGVLFALLIQPVLQIFCCLRTFLDALLYQVAHIVKPCP
jgi:hypothetical protein